MELYGATAVEYKVYRIEASFTFMEDGLRCECMFEGCHDHASTITEGLTKVTVSVERAP